MNPNHGLNKRLLATLAAIMSFFTMAAVIDIETATAWAMVGMLSITAGAVLLYLTRPVPQTMSQAIQRARR